MCGPKKDQGRRKYKSNHDLSGNCWLQNNFRFVSWTRKGLGHFAEAIVRQNGQKSSFIFMKKIEAEVDTT